MTKLVPKDKVEIVVALREAAKGIEQSTGTDLALNLMQAVGTELLVLALKNGPLLDEISGENAPKETKALREAALEMMIRTELAAIVDTIVSMHKHRIKESDILTERLTRMFDPALAYNEAINRAIEAKKAKGETIPQLTDQQMWMWENMQLPSLMSALRNAGNPNPQPMVHRLAVDPKTGAVIGRAGSLEGAKPGLPGQSS